MFEEPAAALADSQALRPLEAPRPWPDIALPVAVVAALLLDLTADAQWGNLRLHRPLELAAAAVALAAATTSWLRCVRAIARSRSPRSALQDLRSRAGLPAPRRVCEGTPYIDFFLWRALELEMTRNAIAGLAGMAGVVSLPRVSGFPVAGESAIPCPAAAPAPPTPLYLEGAAAVRRHHTKPGPGLLDCTEDAAG